MNALSTFRYLALLPATVLVQACAPPSSSPTPRAFQVCADTKGRRVDDQLCRGAAADNPNLWYYFDVGVPIPPLGSPLVGGSLIRTSGTAYATATGADGRTDQNLAPAAQDGPQSPPSETVVPRDAAGAFVVEGLVNGRPVTFVVDTGASEVVLSPHDAASVGLGPASLKYDRIYQTANGVGRGAAFHADEISVGQIRISNVSASVNQAPMRYSLLGRAFLDRLNGFRIERGRLYMR